MSSSTDARPVSGWTGAPSEHGHFRPDIEGLRAVAVFAVLLFHVGVPGFAGGFIGVDVFYVISGFLITGLLQRELATTGRINLRSFYERRLRRLLPAALLVIAVTVLAALILLPRLQSTEVARDGGWAALYVSNYALAFRGFDYLTDVSVSPLLHYWSLGVEEQFYLLWPLIILITARVAGVRRLPLIIIAIGVPSFMLAYGLTHVFAPLAFYSLPTRAWELGIGALLATAPSPLAARLPAVAYRMVAFVGLMMIVVSAILIDPTLGYPDTVALVPAVGAALVIAGGAKAGGVSRLLGMRGPRWIGRISYSLYLWHWPLLTLAPIALGVDNLPVRALLALVSIGVADFSTRAIENPFRLRPNSRRRSSVTIAVAAAASILVASVAFGASLTLRPPLKASVTPAELQRDLAQPEAVLSQPMTLGPIPENIRSALLWASKDVPPARRDDCQADRLDSSASECIYGDDASTTVVAVFGDSHAAQWLAALDDIGKLKGWRIVSYTKAACPPLDAIVWSEPLHRPYTECNAWLTQAVDRIQALAPALVIVSGARHFQLVDGGQRFSYGERPIQWQEALRAVLARLRLSSPNVVLMADTPAYPWSPIDCLASRSRFEDCTAASSVAEDAAYAQIEQHASNAAGAALVSMNDTLCPASSCPLVFGDYLVYRDSGHVTATFSRLLAPRLASLLPTP